MYENWSEIIYLKDRGVDAGDGSSLIVYLHDLSNSSVGNFKKSKKEGDYFSYQWFNKWDKNSQILHSLFLINLESVLLFLRELSGGSQGIAL